MGVHNYFLHNGNTMYIELLGYLHRHSSLLSKKLPSDKLMDDRRIGQRPPLQRNRSGLARGDPSGATSSGCAPRLALEANPTATAEFNDKQPDHKWIVVPAHDSPARFDVLIANCASEVAKTSGLGDNKGTLCFLEYMNYLELELEKLLASDYTHQPDCRRR